MLYYSYNEEPPKCSTGNYQGLYMESGPLTRNRCHLRLETPIPTPPPTFPEAPNPKPTPEAALVSQARTPLVNARASLGRYGHAPISPYIYIIYIHIYIYML